MNTRLSLIPSYAIARTDNPRQCNCCMYLTYGKMRGADVVVARLGRKWAMASTAPIARDALNRMIGNESGLPTGFVHAESRINRLEHAVMSIRNDLSEIERSAHTP